MKIIYIDIQLDEKLKLIGGFAAIMSLEETKKYRKVCRAQESVSIPELKGFEDKTFRVRGYEVIWNNESTKDKPFECRVSLIEHPIL